MTDKEAIKLALELLRKKEWEACDYTSNANEAADILEEALAKQEQGEPVAKVVLTETLGLPCLHWLDLNRQFDFKGGELLYTTPQQRTWVGLTQEDKEKLWADTGNVVGCGGLTFENINAIEAKLKEKNT